MDPTYLDSIGGQQLGGNPTSPHLERTTQSRQALRQMTGYEEQRLALAVQPTTTEKPEPQLTDANIQAAITYNLESHSVSMLIRVRTLLQNEGLLAGTAPEGGYVGVAPTDICTAEFCRAVASYQQVNALSSPDGKLGPTTFALFEALGMEYRISGGTHAAGRTIIPKNAPSDQQYDYFRSVVLENNGVFFDRAGYVNIIGIRGGQLGDGMQITHGDNAFNQWNDTLVVLKVDAKGVKHVDVFEGTTDPGVTRSGVATLPEGTYSYRVGTHKGYTAMNPTHRSVTPAIRNNEAYLGREGTLGRGGASGINIHTTHGWDHGALGGPGAYSEGCSVINGEDRYERFMDHMTTSNKSTANGGAGQTVYYYTVLSAAHFGTMEVESQTPTEGPH